MILQVLVGHVKIKFPKQTNPTGKRPQCCYASQASPSRCFLRPKKLTFNSSMQPRRKEREFTNKDSITSQQHMYKLQTYSMFLVHIFDTYYYINHISPIANFSFLTWTSLHSQPRNIWQHSSAWVHFSTLLHPTLFNSTRPQACSLQQFLR